MTSDDDCDKGLKCLGGGGKDHIHNHLSPFTSHPQRLITYVAAI